MIQNRQSLNLVVSIFNTPEARKKQTEAGKRDGAYRNAFGERNELGTLSAVLDQCYRQAWRGPSLLPTKRVLIVLHAAFEPEPRVVAFVLPDNQNGPIESALKEAYSVSQNIDSSWVEGSKIYDLSPWVREQGGCRSTSVGDGIAVYEMVENVQSRELMPDPVIYRVASCGFEKVSDLSKLGRPY